jgi:hypothetical protein
MSTSNPRQFECVAYREQGEDFPIYKLKVGFLFKIIQNIRFRILPVIPSIKYHCNRNKDQKWYNNYRHIRLFLVSVILMFFVSLRSIG